MKNYKKHVGKEKRTGINPVAVAVAGVGAVVMAGAIALSDKRNRDKAKAVIEDVKGKISGFAKNVQKQVQETQQELEVEKENMKEKGRETMDDLNSAIKDTKKKVDQTAKIIADGAKDQVGNVKKEIKSTWQK